MLASSKEVANEVRLELKAEGVSLPVVQATKALGVDYVCGGRRAVATQTGRRSQCAKKASLFASLARMGAQVAGVGKAGLTAATTWGCSVMGDRGLGPGPPPQPVSRSARQGPRGI